MQWPGPGPRNGVGSEKGEKRVAAQQAVDSRQQAVSGLRRSGSGLWSVESRLATFLIVAPDRERAWKVAEYAASKRRYGTVWSVSKFN